jgi:hypothetical protein
MTHGKYMFRNGLSNDARADKADSHWDTSYSLFYDWNDYLGR